MQQKTDHEAMDPACEYRTQPPTKLMMSESQEGEFERLRISGPEESSWWRMFQLLIPGMDERDVASLKLEYWPYYVKSDSFMIPEMTFSNVVFQPSQASGSSESLQQTNDNSPLPIEFDWSIFNTSAPDEGPISARTLEVPLFEATDVVFADPMTSESASSAAVPSLSVGTSSEKNNSTSSSASSRPPMTNAPSIDDSRSTETVLRRNYDRLRNRYATAERENAELRETAQQARSSLNQIDAALENVLNAEDLPEHIYDKIAEVSAMIASLKERS